MKNLKVALVAFAMLVGIGSAFAYKAVATCPFDTYELTVGAPEAFVSQGTIAVDQDITHYASLSGVSYDCNTSPTSVCVYYFDDAAPVGEKIKQCVKGTRN